ncbi:MULTISPECIES: NAD+ synthase [Pseudomonas syringae group]|uniref:Glutamine-dependent NAD(+) synthetase n=1 Tax=Pseudomonas syringae pv. actinidiae TaxID=103796 RepID=A0A2V0QSQ1_PSESF|nr:MULTISPECIES: NAD+ synthase [Pseudomonas syringae group]EPN18140.1 glutamine-dependent NAD+ synthase [Pseudomonas syringae pv. actinidiae ICMP 19070]AQL39755.1 NAD+ synthase [Pseudomonas syringae pv. actinidiae ICMP 9853]EPN02446.1 glutamine-dependent NAD+ synthase [Pseudomonas syringae pv. actinidiae ICMP 19102]EPN09510.1 glutamine-dependent NAD+ synthase [Pseudomonas syringae pv. actinidiae ICMP 9855]MDG6387348.1 NAD+ synthase [Pseudomonas syringae]
MDQRLRVVMAQLNIRVGDVHGNVEKIIKAAQTARDDLGAHVIVFPELTLCGYPPEDLLLRSSMQSRIEKALARVREAARGIVIVIGFPWVEDGARYNSCAVISEGEEVARYYKQRLPNYRVFDEKRYFESGSGPCVVNLFGIQVGITICEDIWFSEPLKQACDAGAQIMLTLNASPFHRGKQAEREALLAQRADECSIPMMYVNQVGGQDELVFDGNSFVVDGNGKVTQRAPAFEEGLYVTDFDCTDNSLVPVPGTVTELLSLEASVYQALVSGVKDYVHRNGFKGVVLGLSGGIDSALVLAVAADALGAENVEAVMMPYHYTAQMSQDDAREEADILGVKYSVLPIASMVEAFLSTLAPMFEGLGKDTTEENLQARCRGTMLMAISNKKRYLVLTTGNKSEMAVGYATLYGDMAGGFDVLKDVPKTLVFKLCEYRNTLDYVIPQRVIDRPPSAELAPDQKDEDSLPPYPVLDEILRLYVEQDLSADAIIEEGFDTEVVRKVIRLVDLNEYKRRQAAVGPRITERGFGRDRRYPITSGWRIGD